MENQNELSYKVIATAHFFMLDKAFTRCLFHNMLLKQQENNAVSTNEPQLKEPSGMGKKILYLIVTVKVRVVVKVKPWFKICQYLTFIHPSIHTSVRLSVGPSIHPPIRPFFHPIHSAVIVAID